MLLLLELTVLLLGLAIQAAQSIRPAESFAESLLVRRLDDESLGLRFEFVLRKGVPQDPTSEWRNHYETFPKVVGQLMNENVTEVRLVMTRGSWRWRSETLWPSIENGAPGVDLWANLRNASRDWAPLVRALAGMTCSSIDGLQNRAQYGQSPNGAIFAFLPSETVCTENISSWLRLLPCRNRAGLGKLIKAISVVRSEYYSFAWVMRWTPGGLELILSMSVVFPIKGSENNGSLWATLGIGKNEGSIAPCGVASISTVVVEGGHTALHRNPLTLNNKYAVWSLPFENGDMVELKSILQSSNVAPISSTRWISGVGDVQGTLSLVLQNNHDQESLSVTHIEFIPSFLRPRLDTLKIYIGDTLMGDVRERVIVRSSLVRGPPSTLEFALLLPPNKTRVLIQYAFDKAFLYFDEFPPDPNRGFDIPSSITIYNRTSVQMVGEDIPPVWRRTRVGPSRTASSALLVGMSHPDFSMPYNVITLSSTGFALFLGMLINISIRGRGDRWTPRPPGMLARLRARFNREKTTGKDIKIE